MRKERADRRIRRTKGLLRHALTQLLMEKDLKDITVSELTERANINRGTFYLHYQDIYDLFEQTEKEILEDFTGIIANHKEQHRKVLWFYILLDAFKFIAENADIFIAILHTSETTFLSKIIEMSRPQTKAEWEKLLGPCKEDYYEYYYTFITAGCVALLRRWFSEGMPESPEYMAALAGKMMANSIPDLSSD